jgi:VanZ family protein
MKHVIVYLWMAAMYGGTLIAALFFHSKLAPPILELRNVVIHSTGYAVMAGLIVWALAATERFERKRTLAVLAGVGLLMGIGQEILQVVLRNRVFLGNSLFDLGVDTAGVCLCVLLLYRRARRRGDRGEPTGQIPTLNR